MWFRFNCSISFVFFLSLECGHISLDVSCTAIKGTVWQEFWFGGFMEVI